MSSPYIGQIQPFAFRFAPVGWSKCDGNLLPISQNTALFSVLGTTYGGDGKTTFALPDLRGRAGMKFDLSASGGDFRMGQAGGAEKVTLLNTNLPSHSHTVVAQAIQGDASSPDNNYIAVDATNLDRFYSPTANTTMKPSVLSNAGGSQSHNNMEPYLVVNWCIALYGVYPSRG